MLAAWILELIFLIAPQYDVPPYLVAAIIIKESEGNVLAVSKENTNGSVDRGLMQLNSYYFDIEWCDAEINIRTGCAHLRSLYNHTWHTSPNWWSAVVAYNCGLERFLNEPLQVSIQYANDVFEIGTLLILSEGDS